MVRRLLIQVVLSFAVSGAILFGAAGTVRWPAGWVFLCEMWGAGLVIGLVLARSDPALLAERLAPPVQHDQENWDKIAIAAAFALFVGWLVLMGADAVRYRWSHTPTWMAAVGTAGIALGMYLVHLTFRANTFTAPVVKIQRSRGHQVVTSGPYRFVRHPMYAGAAIIFVSTPLLLGSLYGLAAAPLLIGLIGIRALKEERVLRENLDGYSDYAARVRYRLIPLIW